MPIAGQPKCAPVASVQWLRLSPSENFDQSCALVWHELGCCGHADCTRLLTNPLFLSIPLTTLTKGWPGWYVAGWHEYSCSFSWRVSLFPYLCQLCYFDHIVVLAVDRHQWYDSNPENWLRVVYFTPLTLSQLALPSLTRGVATEPWCLHLLAGKLLFRFISCGCNRFKWFMLSLQTIHSILWCSLGLSWPRMQGNRVEVDIFHPSPCVRAHQDIFPNALITASEENQNNMFSPNPRLPLAIWRAAVRTTVIKLCAPEQCAAPYFPVGDIWKFTHKISVPTLKCPQLQGYLHCMKMIVVL